MPDDNSLPVCKKCGAPVPANGKDLCWCCEHESTLHEMPILDNKKADTKK